MHRFDKFLRRKSNIIAGRLNIIHFHVYLFIHSYPYEEKRTQANIGIRVVSWVIYKMIYYTTMYIDHYIARVDL